MHANARLPGFTPSLPQADPGGRAAAAREDRDGFFARGDLVRINGLQVHPELNGTTARICGCRLLGAVHARHARIQQPPFPRAIRWDGSWGRYCVLPSHAGHLRAGRVNTRRPQYSSFAPTRGAKPLQQTLNGARILAAMPAGRLLALKPGNLVAVEERTLEAMEIEVGRSAS